jgi:hypothetical protein
LRRKDRRRRRKEEEATADSCGAARGGDRQLGVGVGRGSTKRDD